MSARHNAPVPPLPPVPGVADGEFQPAGSSILDLLHQEHQALLRLCDAAGTGGPVRQVIVAEACRHLSTEAQYLYPALRASAPAVGDMAELGLAQDVRLLVALQRLQRADGHPAEQHPAMAEVVDLLRDHVGRIDRRLAPALAAACTGTELVRLGNRAQVVREAAPTRPHPTLPVAATVRKLVDPAVGAADKLVDLLTARPTRSQDL